MGLARPFHRPRGGFRDLRLPLPQATPSRQSSAAWQDPPRNSGAQNVIENSHLSLPSHSPAGDGVVDHQNDYRADDRHYHAPQVEAGYAAGSHRREDEPSDDRPDNAE